MGHRQAVGVVEGGRLEPGQIPFFLILRLDLLINILARHARVIIGAEVGQQSSAGIFRIDVNFTVDQCVMYLAGPTNGLIGRIVTSIVEQLFIHIAQDVLLGELL